MMVLDETSVLHSLPSIFHASPRYFQAHLGAKEEIICTLSTHELVENEIDILGQGPKDCSKGSSGIARVLND